MGARRQSAGLVIFILVVGSALGSPSRRYQQLLADEDEMKVVHHRSYCVRAAGKCFSSGQCCKDLVCAAIDDYFGQKPEVPGYCVKEKDLEGCATSADCGEGGRCVSLGRTGERYCLPRSDESVEPEASNNGINELPALPASGHMKGATGGLGATCTYSADCKTHVNDGGDKLCCQNVSRGRMGVRRICDRVTPISSCIMSPRS